MSELNPQPDFATDTGLTLGGTAYVDSGQLVLPAQDSHGEVNGPANCSWTSPETLTAGLYRYDIVADENAGDPSYQSVMVNIGGSWQHLRGAGPFQGTIYTQAVNQTIAVTADDTDFTAKLSRCSINRV